MYLKNAIMETKDSSEKTNSEQSVGNCVEEKLVLLFYLWRLLNMLEEAKEVPVSR